MTYYYIIFIKFIYIYICHKCVYIYIHMLYIYIYIHNFTALQVFIIMRKKFHHMSFLHIVLRLLHMWGWWFVCRPAGVGRVFLLYLSYGDLYTISPTIYMHISNIYIYMCMYIYIYIYTHIFVSYQTTQPQPAGSPAAATPTSPPR